MTDQDRAELEALKRRQAALFEELQGLGKRVAALDQRISAEKSPTPAVPKVLAPLPASLRQDEARRPVAVPPVGPVPGVPSTECPPMVLSAPPPAPPTPAPSPAPQAPVAEAEPAPKPPGLPEPLSPAPAPGPRPTRPPAPKIDIRIPPSLAVPSVEHEAPQLESAAGPTPQPPSPPPPPAAGVPPGRFHKCRCEACGQHLEFPVEAAGLSTKCPQCGAAVRLTVQPEAVARPKPLPTRPAPMASAPHPPAHRTEDEALEAAEAQPATGTSFELKLGTYWLVRIGIVMLLTSLVFGANYAYKEWVGRWGAGGKVVLLYLAGGLLLSVGGWLQRQQQKQAMRNYGQVLFAGGLAAVYFTTYAAHYFENLRVIRSQVLDGVLLLAWAGFIAWLADRKKSEVIAMFAIGLAYYTSFVTDVGLFTLYSSLVLTVASVGFLLRNRWTALSYGSLLATYAGFAFWRFYHNGGWLWDWRTDELWKGNLFLTGYWIAFTAAVFLSQAEKLTRGSRVAFLTLNNSAFFTLVILSMLHVSRGAFWKFSLGYGAVLVALALLARLTLAADPPVKQAYLTQGLLLVTVGFIAYFTGLNLALVLAVESVILLMLGTQLANPILRSAAGVVAALATGWALPGIRSLDQTGLLVGAAVGAVMVFNAFWVRPRSVVPRAEVPPELAYYTVLGLVTWGFTSWQNTGPEWRGLVFAVESVLLFVASGPLQNQVLSLGSYAFGGVGVVWQLVSAANYDAMTISRGAAIGLLMFVNATLPRLWRSGPAPVLGAVHAPYFTVLAQVTWLVTTWNADASWRAVALASESAGFLLASRWLANHALEYGAYVFGALGAGLASFTLPPFETAGLYRGAVVGAIMVFNAFWVRPRSEAPRTGVPPELAYYTVLGLVTWGFTSWQNTGPEWRGLVFAVESVLLFVASGPLQNQVLSLGSYAFGGVGVVWQLVSAANYDAMTISRGAAIGLLMFVNATLPRLWRSGPAPVLGAVHASYFTVLAQVTWLVTTWNADASWRAVALASESAGFLLASRWLANHALEYGAYVFGALGVGLASLTLPPFDTPGLYRGVVIGGLMMFNAFECRFPGQKLEAQLRRRQEAWFTFLALVMWGVATWRNTQAEHRAPVLAVEALLFTGSYYLVSHADLTLFGQLFLVAAQAQCAAALMGLGSNLPIWNPPVVMAISLSHMHWWQRQQRLQCPEALRQYCQALYSLALAGILFFCLKPHFSPSAWVALTSLLALVVTGYGLGTRAWFLSGAGQVFLGASAVDFVRQLYFDPAVGRPAGLHALAPVATLFLFAGPVHRWMQEHLPLKPELRESLRAFTFVYRGVGWVLGLVWVLQYVPPAYRFLALVLIGAFFFGWGGWQRMREPLVVGGAFTLVGLITFWIRFDEPSLVDWPNLVAILVLLAQQQVARRFPEVFPVPPHLHTATILSGNCSLWLYLSRLVMIKAGGFGFYLTAAWAGLALVIFSAGLLRRERMHRWHGLAVLACALARVVIYDVWKLDRGPRILSFMALGVVLLVLGFIYNKYQEKIREWL